MGHDQHFLSFETLKLNIRIFEYLEIHSSPSYFSASNVPQKSVNRSINSVSCLRR